MAKRLTHLTYRGESYYYRASFSLNHKTFSIRLSLETADPAVARQPAHGKRLARTLLLDAAILTNRYRFGSRGLDLAAHSTTVTDDPGETTTRLADRLHNPPARLLLWRAADIVLPSLIPACETARDTINAAKLLRELDLSRHGEVIDVAETYGGSAATSFDGVSYGRVCHSGR